MSGPFRRGGKVTRDIAQTIRRREDAAAIKCVPPLYFDERTNTFYVVLPDVAWAKITGSPATGGKYPATEQFPIASGGWANGPRTWTLSGPTNPLVEVNGVMTVGTVVVRARRGQDGSWRFASVC